MRTLVAVMALGASALAGCVESQLVDCGDGRSCPVGTVCDNAHASCVAPDRLTACDGVADGDGCDAVLDGVCFEGVCIASGCGNGLVEPTRGERCDDGNLVSGDGCTADCRSDERCGNGVLDTGEACDDGNALSHDGCASQCVLEQAVWREQQPQDLAREFAASTYDAARGELVVFGGRRGIGAPGTSPIGSTVLWRGSGWAGWFGRPAAQPSPSRDGAMVFDAGRGETVLFGGFAGAPLNETWTWNGDAWHQRTPTTAPSPRSRHAMAYDPVRRQVVMFGGASGITGSASHLGDTWVWDGTDWHEVATPGPTPRADHRMAYDPAHDEIVLFGGEIGIESMPMMGTSSGLYSNETWVWNGSGWALVDDGASSPISGRGRVGLAWSGSELILHGGATWGFVDAGGLGGAEFYPAQTGTFRWDRAAATWTTIPATGAPSAIPTAFAAVRGALVLLTYNFMTNQGETRILDAAGGWQLQVPSPSPAGTNLAAAYDPIRAQVILTAGSPGATFTWDGGWSRVDATAPTGPMAFDPRDGRVTVLDSLLDRVHRWSGTAWERTDLDAPFPAARSGAAWWFGPDGDAILYGGLKLPNTIVGDHLRLTGTTWQSFVPATSPGARARMALARDGTTAFVFGGAPSLGTYPEGLWAFDATGWSVLPATGQAPAGRESASLTTDRATGNLVLFGGKLGSNYLNDTWEWSAGTWRRPVVEPPAGRQGHVIAYDAVGARFVLFGGQTSTNGTTFTDTWTYQHAADVATEACTWGRDLDGDGLVGCADPDCWGICTPLCPPNTTCDPAAPRCGDARCDATRETARMCPECGPVVPSCGDFFCDPPETAASCPGDC